MQMLTEKLLDDWVRTSQNVLLVGPHGIGKTEQVLAAMKRNGIKYAYFSASTMDPFVDFVGVPRVVEDENGRWLDFIKPKVFSNNDIQVIVVDEFNRAPKKVRNALMEAIQFKSINGVPMPNLKMIWAMVNPHDDEDTYDVDRLDPAQEDRFQIKVVLPNGPSLKYFKENYGVLGEIAHRWWGKIDDKLRKKSIVSPRRLEYAIQAYQAGLDIDYVLPKEVNVKDLKTEFNKSGLMSRLPQLRKMDVDGLRKEIQGNGNLRDLVLGEILEGNFPVAMIGAMTDEEIVNKCGIANVRGFIVERIMNGDSRFTSLAAEISKNPPSKTADKGVADSIKTFASAIEKAKKEAQKKITAKARQEGVSSEALKRQLGVLFQPTLSREELRELLKANHKAISGDEVVRQLIVKATQIAINRDLISEVARELEII
jgi:hypothetical protein